jgi:hypothetical protein
METKSTGIIGIEKEKIPTLKFSSNDVLSEKQDVLQRKIDLERASALGANSKSNVKLYFIDENGVNYRTEATVWAATESNVTLKGEVLLPIKAIVKVGFF